MKVAVLGANETALVALDAICSRGDMEAFLVVPWSIEQVAETIRPSPLNELNFGYPGVEESEVDFRILGNVPWATLRKGLSRAGFEAQMGAQPATSSYRIFEHLKPMLNMWPNLIWVPEERTLRELLQDTIGGADASISTIDRAQLCGKEDGEHTFLATRVWWSPTKGAKVPLNTVVYNTTEAPAWAISSNIEGRQVTIWEHCPPFDDVYHYDLPTKMACDCETPGIDLHLGPWATYKPITPARSYEQIVEFLHHPLARLNDEQADTKPMEKIDGE